MLGVWYMNSSSPCPVVSLNHFSMNINKHRLSNTITSEAWSADFLHIGRLYLFNSEGKKVLIILLIHVTAHSNHPKSAGSEVTRILSCHMTCGKTGKVCNICYIGDIFKENFFFSFLKN